MSTKDRFLSGGLMLVVALAATAAGSKDLAGDSLRKLATGNTWSTAGMLNSAQPASFEWMNDGTVCLRMGSTSGKCDDRGTWKIVDQRICYELTWWLKSYGLTSECLTVEDLGKGTYEAKLPSGSPMFKFTSTK
jgi:hypothetical protein